MKNSSHLKELSIAIPDGYISSDTLSTLSSIGTLDDSDSSLDMKEIMGDDSEDEESLVISEGSTPRESNISEYNDMMFSMSFDVDLPISSPYGGRIIIAAESETDSLKEDSQNTDNPPRSPISTAIAMSPPDNNTSLSNYKECSTQDNKTHLEFSTGLIQINLDAPSLRNLIFGPNHVFPGEVIGLDLLFGDSI